MPPTWHGADTPSNFTSNGRRYSSWDITTTGAVVGTTDEVSIVPPSTAGTITLLGWGFDNSGGGTGTTLQPAVGLVTGFVAGPNFVGQTATAAANGPNRDDLRYDATKSGGKLWIRPAPDASVGHIHLRITIAEGHDAGGST